MDADPEVAAIRTSFVGTFVVAGVYLVTALIQPAWSPAFSGGMYGVSPTGGAHFLLLPFVIFCIAQVQLGYAPRRNRIQLTLVAIAIAPILPLLIMHFLPADKDALGPALIATLAAVVTAAAAGTSLSTARDDPHSWSLALHPALWFASLTTAYRMTFDSGYMINLGLIVTGVLGVVGLIETVVRFRSVRRTLQRQRDHCCLRCGYSLVGLPYEMCPECGFAANAAGSSDLKRSDDKLKDGVDQ